MDYFLLSQKASNPIKLLGLDERMYKNNLTDKKFSELPPVMVAYIDYYPEMEIPDVMLRPMFLVSDALKDIITIYDEEIRWKAVQAMPQSEDMVAKTAPLYWAGNYPTQNCIHQEAEFYPDNRIKELVLDRRKIRGQDIFRVGNLLESRIVISLRLAESILRRNLYGVGLTEMDIR